MFYRNPKKNPEKNKPTTVLGKRNVYRYQVSITVAEVATYKFVVFQILKKVRNGQTFFQRGRLGNKTTLSEREKLFWLFLQIK